ncbi:MAG TPA: UDP-N-acetylenolpyruvoylglucosamine reductase [Clostridiales bacterium]|nr:UDP-N-acetylenolpyruvoylglucosamine reductase [Clostridiales bacterium]
MYEAFLKELGGVKYERDKPLSDMTTFRLGGKADLVIYPTSTREAAKAISLLKGEAHYVVLGGGSNVLCSDKGFRGVVISTKLMNSMRLWGSILVCGAGVRMKDAVKIACDNTLGGLEFAVGIPGTVGGFIAMNGGCFNKCAADRVCYVVGEGGVYNNETCCFDYRRSRFSDGEAIFEAAFRLKVTEQDLIEAKLTRFKEVRKKSQPKGASSGCCFLNEGFFAGKVIDQAGLKGFGVGGATVASKHANFIISDGGTAADVYKLIQTIKEKVYERAGITLHEEIKFIGEF